MAYADNIIIGYCEQCHNRGLCIEYKLISGRVIRLCEGCLKRGMDKIEFNRKLLEQRDKQVEGDSPPDKVA